jgi:type II secretory pathway component PulF
MAQYRYNAMDKDGQAVSGVITADTSQQAISALAGRSVFVTTLQDAAQAHADRARAAGGEPAARPMRRRHLSARGRAMLFRQLATALKAGLPLLPALQIVRDQAPNDTLGTLGGDLAQRVQAGESFSEALEAHGRQFSALEVSMARVGETAGLLDQIMGYLADFAEQDLDVRQRVRTAAVYPLFVLGLAIVSITVIVTFIVPRVLSTITDATTVLPWPTQVLLAISHSIVACGLTAAGVVIGGVWGFRRWVGTPRGRLAFDTFKLRVPVLGTALRRVAIARFARTLGTLSKSGIQILEALRVLRDTLGNESLARQIDRVAAGITQGQSIAEPLRQTGQFPPLLIQVIAMGERTGRLDELLLQTAQVYEKETAAAIQRTMTILPAVFIVLMALVVLFVLSAVLLPIVNMNLTGT